MGWYKSIILHPFANRFNFLFLIGWAITCWSTKGVAAFLIGLAIETIYFGARLALEFSGRPLWQLRFLEKNARERYFNVVRRVRQIRHDLRNVGTLETLLEGQIKHVKRLAGVFIELLIVRSRIDNYVRGIRENYDQKIAEIKDKLTGAEGEVAEILRQNLSIYEQRRRKYFEVMDKRAVIEARLDAIENTLNLLGDYALGMAQPGEAKDQMELLISNIKDAETFVNDVNTAIPQGDSLRMRVRV